MSDVRAPGAPGTIRFGTDGWRGRIADDFSFSNVRRVARAAARHHLARGEKRPVLVGYDTRFLSAEFAAEAARVMAAEGLAVLLSTRAAPTPAVSHFVARQRLGGGVVVTASHNPAHWNGVKLKTADGASADETVTRDVESRIEPDRPADPPRTRGPRVRGADPMPGYLDALARSCDLPAIVRRRVSVVADAMHGASGEAMGRLLRPLGRRAQLLRAVPDPLFGGAHPEPIPPHVAPLLAETRRRGATLGFATDGDGDRVGCATSAGDFVNSHLVFALTVLHLVGDRGLAGEVVGTVTTTVLIRRICQHFSLPFVETPVGFKHIAARMRSGGTLAGGEESGGIAVARHLPERDGLLVGLTLARMCAVRGRDLAALVSDLLRRFGPVAYDRSDLALHPDEGGARVDRIAADPPLRVGGLTVESVGTSDGVKLSLAGDAWIMFRASGTEPILRIYAEAETPSQVARLLSEGRRMVGAGT